MKNYYEILEVNKKASKEVIQTAYKVLIKKYNSINNINSNEIIEDIKEAYQVLSNEFLRSQYDLELERQEQNKISKINNKNEVKAKVKTKTNKTKAKVKTKVNVKEENDSNTKKQRKVKDVKKHKIGSTGRIIQLVKEMFVSLFKKGEKEKTTKIDLIAVGLTIVILILIGVILWFIPFTNGWMRQLLFENVLFNFIGGLFSK